MVNSNLTHLIFLLDRSGSMQSIKSDVIGGFDAFLAELTALVENPQVCSLKFLTCERRSV